MKFKPITSIILIILLVTLVYATQDTPIWSDGKIGLETMDSDLNWSAGTFSAGIMSAGSADVGGYVHQLANSTAINTNNITINFLMVADTGTNGHNCFVWQGPNVTSRLGGISIVFGSTLDTSLTDIGSIGLLTGCDVGDWCNITATRYVNGSVTFAVNGTQVIYSIQPNIAKIGFNFVHFGSSGDVCDVRVDHFIAFNGTSLPAGPPPPPPPTEKFNVTASDSVTGAVISNYTVILINSTDTYTNRTTTGEIVFNNITGGIYNITISSNQSGGYHTANFTDYNATVDLSASLDKLYRVINFTYTGMIEANQSNYTRNLLYEINYNCVTEGNVTLDTYINETLIEVINLSCTNNTISLNDSYTHTTEGNFTIYHLFNVSAQSADNNQIIGNTSFISDLLNPTVSINLSTPEGFAIPNTNVTLICTDNIFIFNLTYNSTFNNIPLFFGNASNGTKKINESLLLDGTNILIGFCADPFGSTTLIRNITIFNAELILIDEIDNTLFDVKNVTSARAYFDDNQTFFDFKLTNTSKVNFSSSITNKLRVELIYADGITITRHLDTGLIPSPARICANKEGVEHFQQLIISARERSTILRNIFANCIVAADTTRFAFQDSFVLQAFTISSTYTLATLREGREIILASLDGSLESFINLDTLELSETPFKLNIQPESISFEKSGSSNMRIIYKNLKKDNIGLTLTITNMKNNELVLNQNTFQDFNEVTIFFDFSTLSNVTNSTLFVIQADSVQETTTNSFKRYFNINASSGIIRTELAFLISFLLVIFGLTFAAVRITLSWFGIFIMIFAISVLSFAVLTPAVILLMAVETILLIFIGVVLAINTYSTLT